MVRVIATARLHLGMVDPVGIEGRRGICVGLSIQEPKVIIEVSRSFESEYLKDPIVVDVLNRLKTFYNIDIDNISIKIVRKIPNHVGLGSTTQTKLAIAVSILELFNIRYSIENLSKILGRGEISGVGIYTFKYGGFVVDSGKKSSDDIPKLITRLEFPEDWYIIVAIPPGKGPDEISEHKLFKLNYPKDVVKELSFILFNKIIPSILDKDFEMFCEGLEEFQKNVGKIFSNIQGGIFSKYSQKVVNMLKEFSVKGIGQSSWGPTVYAFIDDFDRGLEIVYKLRSVGIYSFLTTANNRGAVIEY